MSKTDHHAMTPPVGDENNDYMAFLKATNQIETFRAWQLQNTREQEHDYSEDEHGTSVSESVSSEHAKESVSDEGSIDHDVADILTTEDEENDEETDSDGNDSSPADQQPATAQLVIAQPVTAPPIIVQPATAPTIITQTALAQPVGRRTNAQIYQIPSKIKFSALLTENLIRVGDELRVPVTGTGIAITIAVLTLQSRQGGVSLWGVNHPPLGITQAQCSFSGPRSCNQKLLTMGISGPGERAWPHRVTVYRGGNRIGTVHALKLVIFNRP